MSNFSQQQTRQKENKEKDKLRKEKLSAFFYNLASLSFAALVLGTISPILAGHNTASDAVTIPFGIFATVILAYIANKILK